jgi:hypothetical protein
MEHNIKINIGINASLMIVLLACIASHTSIRKKEIAPEDEERSLVREFIEKKLADQA